MQDITEAISIVAVDAEPTTTLLLMPVDKIGGIYLDPKVHKVGSWKSAIIRLNADTEMWFNQKTINGLLRVRRVA
jgi:hypothetical protein